MTTEKSFQKWRFSTEPYLLFYVTALLLHSPIFQQYVYYRVSEEYGYSYTYSNQKSCKTIDQTNITNISSNTQEIMNKVQGVAARLETGFVMLNMVPAAIMCLFTGHLSDRYGRKPILLMSITGAFLQTALILAVITFKLPIWVILIATGINGLSGYLTGLLMSTFAFIADITLPEQRGARLARVEAIVFLGGTFASSFSGHLLNSMGFQKSFIVILALIGLALLYAIFILPESLSKAHRQSLPSGKTRLYCLEPLKRINRVVSRPRSGKWKIKLFISASVAFNMLTIGLSSTTMLFMLNRPLCMSAINVGYAIGVRFICLGIGAALGLKILLKYLPDFTLMIFGALSMIGSLSVLAFSTQEWMVYASAGAAFAAGFPLPLFRSNLSKTVDADEQGSIFSLSTTLEMLFAFVGTLCFNASYSYTNTKMDFKGAVFLLACMVALIPLSLAIIYGITMRLEQNRTLLIDPTDIDKSDLNSTQKDLLITPDSNPYYGAIEKSMGRI